MPLHDPAVSAGRKGVPLSDGPVTRYPLWSPLHQAQVERTSRRLSRGSLESKRGVQCGQLLPDPRRHEVFVLSQPSREVLAEVSKVGLVHHRSSFEAGQQPVTDAW
jgi:hypothetical protein